MDHATPRSPNDGVAAEGRAATSRDEFTRRVLITAGVVLATTAIVAVLVRASSVFLILFGAVLLAILLRAAADAIARRSPLTPGWAYAAVLVVLTLAAANILIFAGSTAGEQFERLAEELPTAVERARGWLGESSWGRQLLRWGPTAQEAVTDRPQAAAGQVAAAFSTTFGAIGDAVVLLFLTLYLGASPRKYVDGLVRLVPPARRPRAREVLGAIGDRLRGWMLGQLVSMAAVAVMVGGGLALVGVPQAPILGAISGLATGVPYIGPILGAIPGLLLALSLSPGTALQAFGVYAASFSLEGYVITPLIQQRTSELPPVLTLLAIALAGALFGLVGLLVAAPLAVAVQTAVEQLYVEDVLGDRRDHEPPAEADPAA